VNELPKSTHIRVWENDVKRINAIFGKDIHDPMKIHMLLDRLEYQTRMEIKKSNRLLLR